MAARVQAVVVVCASAAIALAISLFRLHDDDVGFHVANGRLVREALGSGRDVPTTNPFSYAVPGHPWTQHQWLPAAAISWLVDDAPDLVGVRGEPGRPDARVLVAVKAVLFALLFAALAAGAMAEGAPPAAVFAVMALAVAAASPRFYERPFLLSALGLAATVLALRAWQRRRRPVLLVAAVAVPVVNAHLHAGVFDAILAWAGVVAGAVVSYLCARARGAVARFPWLLVAAFLAMLATAVATLAAMAPSGIQVLLLPLRMTGSEYWAAHLKEFRPLWDALLPMWPAVAFVILLLALLAFRRRDVDPGGHMVALGFAALAIRHQRMVLSLVVASLPVLGVALAGAARDLRPRVSPGGWRAMAALAVVMGLAVAWSAFVMQSGRFRMGLGDARDGGIDPTAHPFALLDRIEKDRLPGEVFVSDGFAGTFLWRLYPPRRVLVHTDLEAYPVEVFEDPYQLIRYAREGFEDRIRSLGVRTFLLKHTTPGERRAAQGRPNIRDVLFERSGTGRFPDAVLVDFDDAGALWVLRDALPRGVRALDGFPVNPDTGLPRAGAGAEEVRRALLDHAASHPGTERALVILRALFQPR